MCLYRNFWLFCLIVIVLSYCKPKKDEMGVADINQYSWGTVTQTVIENGFYHSKKSLDTTLNQLIGDTLIPIATSGIELIIKKLEPLKMEMKTVDGVEDFYITKTGFKLDTFIFDVKNYFGKTFLILLSENSANYAYELKNENVNISETNNLYFPDFKIEGYAVGDVIDREDIEVMSSDQFGTLLTEQAIFKNNTGILLKIIDEKYIEEIQWKNIDNSEVQNIVKQLNSNFNSSPDIELITEDNQPASQEILQYYWSENEVHVLLTRANEFGDLDDVWSLTYSNLIVSNILNNYLAELPKDL